MRILAFCFFSLFIPAFANVIPIHERADFLSHNHRVYVYFHQLQINNKSLFVGVECDSANMNWVDTNHLWGQFVSQGGSLAEFPFPINIPAPGRVAFITAASLSDQIFVVWSKTVSRTQSNLLGRLFDTAGNPIGPEITYCSQDSTDCIQPQVFALGNTYGLFYKKRAYSTKLGIMVGQEITRNGTPIGAGFNINTPAIDMEYNGAVQISGGFLLSWAEQLSSSDQSNLFAEKISESFMPSGTKFHLATYLTGVQQNLITHKYNNGIIALWESWEVDGDGYGIAGQLLDLGGGKIGTEFQVNTTSAATQAFPIAASCNSNILVTWESRASDSFKVYGQLLNFDGSKAGPEILLTPNCFVDQWSHNLLALDTAYILAWRGDEALQDTLIHIQALSKFGVKMGAEFKVSPESGFQFGGISLSAINADTFCLNVVSFNSAMSKVSAISQFFCLDNENSGIRSVFPGFRSRPPKGSANGRVSIYDTQGRLVRVVKGSLVIEKPWSGAGFGGRLPTGHYLVRYEDPTSSITRKATYLK